MNVSLHAFGNIFFKTLSSEDHRGASITRIGLATMSSDDDALFPDGIGDSGDEAAAAEQSAAESADDSDGGGASRGRAKASNASKKGKAKAKVKPPLVKKTTAKQNKYSKAKDGKKYCRACGKHLPLASFPDGSANCTKDKPAVQNLKNLAKGQGKSVWFEETYSDEGKPQRAVSACHKRCPVIEGKRASKFKVLKHIEDCFAGIDFESTFRDPPT